MRLVFPVLLFIISIKGVCQFNDTVYHFFRLYATGTFNKTERSNSYLLNNSISYSIHQKRIIINSSANWVYGELQSNLTNNDFGAHGDIDMYKGVHKTYLWALVNYDKSFSLNVNNRLQVGGGAAYDIVNSPSIKFNISDGFVFEEGDIIDATAGRDVYQVVRNSFRLLYHFSIRDRFMLDGSHFFQPSLSSLQDYIVQSSDIFSVKLSKWLNLAASLLYNRMSRTKRENFLITYGVTIESYF